MRNSVVLWAWGTAVFLLAQPAAGLNFHGASALHRRHLANSTSNTVAVFLDDGRGCGGDWGGGEQAVFFPEAFS